MARLAVLLICALILAAPRFAAGTTRPQGDPSALCLAAAEEAAARHGIPAAMMRAITLVETRRKTDGISRPWPWTLNIGGQGYWFESRAEALALAEREMARGRRSIDLGCFQLNYRWHGSSFSDPDEMLEPQRAADYAAAFLAELYAETGNWIDAAGFYHSRTPVHAARYRGLVTRTLARGGTTPEQLAALDIAPRRAPAGPAAGRAAPEPAAASRAQPASAAGQARLRPGAVALSMFAAPSRPLLPAAGRR